MWPMWRHQVELDSVLLYYVNVFEILPSPSEDQIYIL